MLCRSYRRHRLISPYRRSNDQRGVQELGIQFMASAISEHELQYMTNISRCSDGWPIGTIVVQNIQSLVRQLLLTKAFQCPHRRSIVAKCVSLATKIETTQKGRRASLCCPLYLQLLVSEERCQGTRQ